MRRTEVATALERDLHRLVLQQDLWGAGELGGRVFRRDLVGVVAEPAQEAANEALGLLGEHFPDHGRSAICSADDLGGDERVQGQDVAPEEV